MTTPYEEMYKQVTDAIESPVYGPMMASIATQLKKKIDQTLQITEIEAVFSWGTWSFKISMAGENDSIEFGINQVHGIYRDAIPGTQGIPGWFRKNGKKESREVCSPSWRDSRTDPDHEIIEIMMSAYRYHRYYVQLMED